MKQQLTEFLDRIVPRVEAELGRRLPDSSLQPCRLHEAMRYSVFAGGKRLRPALCMAACGAVGGDPGAALAAAAAIECFNTYTLIHDDLPAMDDDDLRRGRPTCHIKFGEAIAILAGDALQAHAYEVLASQAPPAPFSAAALVHELALRGGSRGVVGGQVVDMEAEGLEPDETVMHFVHLNKTAALIAASVRIGGMLGGAAEEQLDALSAFGRLSGLAFQMRDDVLNATSTAAELGKATGSDAARGKLTAVAVYGLEGASQRVAEMTEDAKKTIAALPRPEVLCAIADYVASRAK